MPPKRRGAKRDLAHEQSDTPEAINTPTKKRRKVRVRVQGQAACAQLTVAQVNAGEPAPTSNSRVPTRPPSVQSDKTIGSDDENRDHEPLTDDELIQHVVSLLRIAPYVTNAQVELSNDIQQEDPDIQTRGSTAAYAKIEGSRWVYFAKTTRITIGRGEHGYSAQNRGQGGTQGIHANGSENPSMPTASSPVDIDLGPDKQVSRIHAWIEYDPTMCRWYVIVNGRNGLRMDDRHVDRGEKVALRCGSVLNVCGTDMIFVCPGQPLEVHPYILSRDKKNRDSADGEGGHDEQSQQQHAQGNGSGKASFSGSIPTSSGPVAPNTPIPARVKQNTSPKIKTSPAGSGSAYSRGVMLASTEEIDYSADSAKDLKPPHSYAQLIGQAIMSSPEEQLTLANIYEYIKRNYAFYRYSGGGWQNSIRHNLSLSKCFEKVARRTDEPGKGMKWRLVPEEREAFLKKGIHTKKARMGSSGPNSPAVAQASERLNRELHPEISTPSQPSSKFRVKDSPRSLTPPLASYPTANESYTPDRGPKQPSDKAQASGNQLFTPSNVRHTLLPSAHAPNSTQFGPTNGYKSVALNDLPDSTTLNGLVTPLVAKNRPHLAPPSTAKMPSQYCYLSSPAPFWKFADLGSTPARPLNDFSPSKEARPIAFKPDEAEKAVEEDDEEEDDDDDDAPEVQPSSPPVAIRDDPIRSREGSRSGEGDSQELSPATPTRPSSRRFNTLEEVAVKKQLPGQLDATDEREEGIDLMK
ncbi:hypothetical protein K490DRAFT_31487 [Saccharata proteae CBS 121410]|uniref:Uncharacterized protein n=1 Tax=Saccharata proteae CBS 121410 TaxID=1314787 RepID=A0A9P4I153_9PEZI|nr:hypothetical protein K490DRAFT_31487 [Saccharata proteae CBS 121410]